MRKETYPEEKHLCVDLKTPTSTKRNLWVCYIWMQKEHMDAKRTLCLWEILVRRPWKTNVHGKRPMYKRHTHAKGTLFLRTYRCERNPIPADIQMRKEPYSYETHLCVDLKTPQFTQRDLWTSDKWTRQDTYSYQTHLCVHLKRPMYAKRDMDKRDMWTQKESYSYETHRHISAYIWKDQCMWCTHPEIYG